MFVKKSWNTQTENPKPNYSIVESYRDPETGTPKHRTIMNISDLPIETIDAITLSLKGKELLAADDLSLSTDDAYRGAGLLAIYRLWKTEKMDKVLDFLTPAQRESAFAMVAQRILKPGSKNAVKDDFSDAVFSRVFSKKRTDANELYSVMDELYQNCPEIQKKLKEVNETSNMLLLYDITSTYFEGVAAEEGAYGYSRDKRFDRFQIVIGLVCNERGIPLAFAVWPGNTQDKSTVKFQVEKLRDEFGIEKAVLIGDQGMYSKTNIDTILQHGFDYIMSAAWQTQRKQLLKREPEQLSLLDDIGVLEWEDGGKRYIGCASKWRRERQLKQRIAGMNAARKELKHLKHTASKGRYYSWTGLRKKTDLILEKTDTKDLWKVDIKPVNADISPEEKGLFEIEYRLDAQALRERKMREGKFVLETSLSKQKKDAEAVKQAFMQQPQIERAFRNIKSFMKIRPVYHWRRRRIHAHVLICFLAFYLNKKAEIEFREQGITKEAVMVLRDWDKLKLTTYTLTAEDYEKKEWQWQMGENGQRIQKEIQSLNWWRSIQGYKRSLLDKVEE